MNCPECGATVGADEKFCGNCGTPLQNSTPQAGTEPAGEPAGEPADEPAGQDQPEWDEQPQDVEPAWDLPEQETVYSESAQFTPGPTPLPEPDTYVPDPAGAPQEYISPSSPPPVERAPAAEKGKNTKLIIAIVALVLLLLCCCVAVIVAVFVFGSMEEGQSLYMVIPSLTATL